MNNQEKGYYQDNQASIVAKLEKLVEDYTREAEKAKKEGGFYKMLRGDRMTAKKCLTASRNGEWEKAKDIALWCDTMVRERMPDDFWTFE